VLHLDTINYKTCHTLTAFHFNKVFPDTCTYIASYICYYTCMCIFLHLNWNAYKGGAHMYASDCSV